MPLSNSMSTETAILDGAMPVNEDGTFTWSPRDLEAGAVTIQVRTRQLNDDGLPLVSGWTSLAITMENVPDNSVQITQLGLAVDNGASDTDRSTSDPTISGQTNTPVSVIQLDTDGDWRVDTTIAPDGSGAFSYALTELLEGLTTVHARVAIESTDPFATSDYSEFSAWETLTFVYAVDPDSTEAQAKATALATYEQELANADNTFDTSMDAAELTYWTSITNGLNDYATGATTAAANRDSAIANANATLRNAVNTASASFDASLATVAADFAADLSAFTGDTTAFQLEDFQWPQAPTPNAVIIPDPSSLPQPPAHILYGDTPYTSHEFDTSTVDQHWLSQQASQSTSGFSYPASSDEEHKDGIADVENDHQTQLKDLQDTYNEALKTAKTELNNAKRAAAGVLSTALATAESNYETAKTANHPTLSVQGITQQHNEEVEAAKRTLEAEKKLHEFWANIQIRFREFLHQQAISQREEQYANELQEAEDVWLWNTGFPTYEEYAAANTALESQKKMTATQSRENDLADAEKAYTDAVALIVHKRATDDAHSIRKYEKTKNESRYNFTINLVTLEEWQEKRDITAWKNYLKAIAEAREVYDKAVANAQKAFVKARADAKEALETGRKEADHQKDLGKAEAEHATATSFHGFMQSAKSEAAVEKAENKVDQLSNLTDKAASYFGGVFGAVAQKIKDGVDAITGEVIGALTAKKTAEQDEAEETGELLSDETTARHDYLRGKALAWKNLNENAADAQRDYAITTADANRDFEQEVAIDQKHKRSLDAPVLAEVYAVGYDGHPLTDLIQHQADYDIARLTEQLARGTTERTAAHDREDAINLAVLGYRVGKNVSDPDMSTELGQLIGTAKGINELVKNYAYAVAESLEAFDVDVTAIEQTFFKALAVGAEGRVNGMSTALTTWIGSTNTAEGTYVDESHQLLKDKMVADATDEKSVVDADQAQRQTQMVAWDNGVNSSWSQRHTEVFDAGVAYAGKEGDAKVAAAGAFGAAGKTLATSQQAAQAQFSSGQVAAVTTQMNADAGSQTAYVNSVAGSNNTNAVNTAGSTETLDKALADASEKHANSRDLVRYSYRKSYFNGYYTFQQDVAEATYSKNTDNIGSQAQYDIDMAWWEWNDGTIAEAEQIAATLAAARVAAQATYDAAYEAALTAKYLTWANAARDYINGKAAAYKVHVTDEGVAMRAWATAMAGHEKSWAGEVKGHADALSLGYKQHSKTATTSLASVAETYMNQSTAADVLFDNNVAGAEADLVGAIAQAEADRQVDVSAAENKYVTALHAEHASQLQGVANANALANVDNAGADLTNYHASAAGITHTAVAAAETHIGVWAQSTADASVALINGITGAGENLVASVGLAVTTSGTMFASAVKSFSQSVGHGVADLVHGVSKAGNQRDESDLGAEADYWADLVDAQADYNDTVATAEVSRASKIATAVRTRIIARETEAAWQAYYTAEEAANAHFEDVDEPAARKTKVEAIGDAMIARAGSLGDNLITETSSMGAAATTYTSADNGATTTFVQTQAAARELHDNDSAVAGKTFIQEAFGAVETNVGAEGAANVALENSLGGARVTAARNLAGAEADYHATASEGTHSYYSASAASSSSPLASWEADREDAFGDWLLSMKLPYQDFVEGQAQREATLGVALVDAEGTVSSDIAAANTVYYTGLANDEVNATASLGAVETTLENLITGQENVYASAMTGEQNTLDDSYASAAKQYAIDEATAEKAFMVALITGTVEDAEQAKALALANAEITRATTEGDADLLWSTGEAGQFRTLRTETANGAFTQVAPTLLAHKTQALGNAGHQATWLTSVTNADNDYAMAQVVAYNNADISDVTTISVFQTASMNHQATQFTALATSSGLPFVDFRAQQSTAQAASLSSQHAGKLASATTIASIYTSAQTDINNLYSAHATAVNAANATWVEAFTTAQNTEATAKELAEKTYVAETAGPLEAYQVQLAVADRAYKIASAVARRDALAAGLTVDNSAAIAAHRQAVQSADGTLNQADATANATRVTSRSSAATTGADAKKLANQAQTEQLNLAEKDLIQDEAARKATRDIDVVTEVHAQALAELNAHTTVVNDLATSLPDNPWAQNEQATWASEVNYLSESLAQDLARAIGDINAKASMTEAMAGLDADLSDVSYNAEYTAEVAGTQASASKTSGQAGAYQLLGDDVTGPSPLPSDPELRRAAAEHQPPKPEPSIAARIFGAARIGGSYAKGVLYGIVVDGFGGTGSSLASLAKRGFYAYNPVVASIDAAWGGLTGTETPAQRIRAGDLKTANQAAEMLSKYGPYAVALHQDLERLMPGMGPGKIIAFLRGRDTNLLGMVHDLDRWAEGNSATTKEFFEVAGPVIEEIVELVKKEFVTASGETKAYLLGRFVGALTFEIALTAALGGVTSAKWATKLDHMPGVQHLDDALRAEIADKLSDLSKRFDDLKAPRVGKHYTDFADEAAEIMENAARKRGLDPNQGIVNMAIPRKKVLQNIAGKRKAIDYHLDDHIPELIGEADKGLVEYWRKEVSARIREMEEWAGRLSKNDDILEEAAQYRRRLDEILDRRLGELGD